MLPYDDTNLKFCTSQKFVYVGTFGRVCLLNLRRSRNVIPVATLRLVIFVILLIALILLLIIRLAAFVFGQAAAVHLVRPQQLHTTANVQPLSSTSCHRCMSSIKKLVPS